MNSNVNDTSASNEKARSSGRPEWVPDGAGGEFATRVMGGVDDAHDGMAMRPRRVPFPAAASSRSRTMSRACWRATARCSPAP